MHDPVSELLTTIRNGASALLPTVVVPHSKLKEAIAATLLTDIKVAGDKVKTLTITLKYAGKTSVITKIKQVSTPGLRRYVGADSIPRVLGGMGVSVVSTPRGVMTGTEAYRARHGGELLCIVW
jgi:small subunit ribosomal protein S8